MSPIQLIPHQGRRLGGGTRYMFGAYDMRADRLFGRLRAHKSARDVLGFLETIRMRYPTKRRIYLIMDNLSTHWTRAIRDWVADSNVELVPTPTYASFLNRIECQFWAIREFTIENTDYPDWGTLATTRAGDISLRNRNRSHGGGAQLEARRRVAEPKTPLPRDLTKRATH
jgi:hypothetical protein